jgi:hypothetical protein
MMLDLGYTGTFFSVDNAFNELIKDKSTNNVFVTDCSDLNVIKFKFELAVEPKQINCQDPNKTNELKLKLVENGFIDVGNLLLNQNGTFLFLYVF